MFQVQDCKLYFIAHLNSESKLCSSFLIEMEKNILLRLTVTYCLPEAVNLLQQRNHIWHGR